MKEVDFTMYRFTNDYSECCHPKILQAISDINTEGNFGYSTDLHCAHAVDLIRQAVGDQAAAVHFLVGGTQVNATAICAFLRPHQAVIATEQGHPCGHETGAIEATGHKVIPVPCAPDARITPETIAACCKTHPNEHNVQPKLVYLSSSSEMGAVYTGEELKAISRTCKQHGLYLFLDGARLASALAAGGASLTEIARYCDAFTIGATKNGALFGEALVIPNLSLAEDLRYIIKQRGGLLAKGFLLGVQFEVLFTDGLYEQLGRHSTQLAVQLRDGMKALGVTFLSESPSNQQFPILPNAVLAALEKDFHWETVTPVNDAETCIRLVTSWATKQEAVDAWLNALSHALSVK